MRILVLFFGILLSVSGSAQLIEGPENVLDTILGKPLFELKDSLRVYTYQPEENWYRLSVVALVKNEDLQGNTLAAGAVLEDSEGEPIGKTLVELEVKETKTVDKRAYRKKTFVRLEGWLYRTKFHRNSIPEERLASIFNARKKAGQTAAIEEMVEINGFQKFEEGDYLLYVKSEENVSLEVEKDFRMIIVYRGSSLFCVITNRQEFEPGKYKDLKKEGPYTFTYFQRAPDKVHEEIRDLMYAHVAL